MNYKIEGAIKKNKTSFIIFIILWIIIAIVFVPLITYSIHMAKASGGFDANALVEAVMASTMHPLQTFGKVFELKIAGDYISTLLVITIFYSVFFFIGFVKSAPKNRYTDIEHGSSDWSQRGEQYRILNKNKGIVLAENNYLPVDKQGNVNVLVVGRFRCW